MKRIESAMSQEQRSAWRTLASKAGDRPFFRPLGDVGEVKVGRHEFIWQ